MFKLTSIALALFITTAINIVVSSISWQRRKSKGGIYFALGMTAVTLWTLAAGLGYSEVPLNLKILFAKIDAVGYNSALPFFVLFAMQYAGLDEWAEKKWIRILLFLLPLSNIVLIASNELHQWVWQNFVPVEGNIVVFIHGSGFIWVAITGYLMMLSMIGILWLASRKGSDISRRQGRLLFYASIFPLAANMIYLFGVKGAEGVDWSSITFSITGLLFLRALYGLRLLDLSPIARDKLVNSLSDGMIVLDTQNRIIDINQAAAEMLAALPTMLLGKDLTDVEPLYRSLLGQPPEQEIKTEMGVGTTNKHYFDVLISPLREGTKKIIGRLIIFRDITKLKENELRFLQLTQAVEQNPASVIITDLQGNIEYVNPQFSILTGYTHEESIGKKTSIIKSGHTPEEVYQDMWQTLLAGKPWRGEFLNKKKNGDLYWEQAVMAPVLDHEGNILNFIAVKEDITARKQVEVALRTSEERFRQLVMSAPDAVFGVEEDGNIVFANHQAAKLLGYMDDELNGLSIEILVPDNLREKHATLRAGYFAKPRTRTMGANLELTAKRKDGSRIPVGINLSYSTTKNGPLVIAFMRDITERKLAEDKLRNAHAKLEEQLKEIRGLQHILREQAIRDALTGLHNRHYLNETLERELARAKRANYPICFVMIDIDRFKSINDKYGHLAGDNVLRHFASQLLKHTRTGDIVCRYGGEEFLVVLPNTKLDMAAQIAERWRITTQESKIIENGAEITATISCGISEFPTDGSTEAEVLEKADKALYAAKDKGRNQVVLWSKINSK